MITKPVLENTHRYKIFLLNYIEKTPDEISSGVLLWKSHSDE
jgi:hypothetical protein